jgi:phosphoglycolate phosphatase
VTRAVVFDLDGTLIDSAPDIRVVANKVLAGEGALALTLSETRSFIGHGARNFVTRMMAARGLPDSDLDRLHRLFLGFYDDAHGFTVVYPGVHAALAALRADGFVLGVCTNRPSSAARAALKHFGLADFFATVIGGDSLPVTKPDPAPLLRALADLGATKGLYVGDSEVDHQTARAAGLPFVLFTLGYRSQLPEAFTDAHPFDDFTLLPAIVARLV